ncbi:MAG: 4Fe-4S cluster-binding domain-containing protein [Bacteroidales bacterium]|nr:4Fe-4S cluster-binding domain-containing protein [Bacteroidales bacterium]
MDDIFEEGKKLPLIDEFYSLQGEGFHFGKAAYFIRIGGCDIGCHWCDTKYSWRADKDKLIDVDTLVKNVTSTKADTIVVTGGEPLTYELDYLTEEMYKANIQTFIETSGAYKLTGKWNWICLSPKKNAPPTNEIIPLANELKVIVIDESDFEWAEKYAALVNTNCKLYLQPEWSRRNFLTPKIVEYIKNDPKWNISIQAHKFMKIP